MKPQEHIQNNIKLALDSLGYDTSDPRLLNLETPKQENFGDISWPAAMTLAKVAKKAPRKIAEDIVEKLDVDPHYVEKINIAGPGFINFFLAPKCLQNSVHDILTEGENFGQGFWGNSERIQIEYISANPTGPLNVVSARAASVGDTLIRLFNAVGYHAHSEFYVNDAGRQVRLLGESLSARYLTELGEETAVPEEGYHGEYLVDLAKKIVENEGDKYQSLEADKRNNLMGQISLANNIKSQKNSLQKYRIEFDKWYHESDVRAENLQDQVLNVLGEKDLTYKKDGALWFKSSDFGDEKDRVLVTSEGEPTYFLIDIAYHETKYERGFSKIHDLWGPDHHGYIARMSAALQALGHPKESFHVGIIQQVNLLRDGQVVKMSKRAGKLIEMDELVDEVGVDAARYFFIDRRMSQPLDFDIELAKQKTDENPVCYIQYAHARICNIIRHAEETGHTVPNTAATDALVEELEMSVIKKLLDFPDTISKAAQFMEPHRVTTYLTEAATIFHRFYHNHKVVTENVELTNARLMLCKAVIQVLANGLKMLGISAPQHM
jgi:arginyl-tRNA synthetase